jgi:hypothetical protein
MNNNMSKSKFLIKKIISLSSLRNPNNDRRIILIMKNFFNKKSIYDLTDKEKIILIDTIEKAPRKS